MNEESKELSNSEKMEMLEGKLIESLISKLDDDKNDINGCEKLCGMIVSLLKAKADIVRAYSSVE